MLPPPPPPPPPPFAAYPFGQPSQILTSSGAGTSGPGGPLTPRGGGPPPPSPGAAAATAAALAAAAAAAAGPYSYHPIIYWPYPSPPVSPTSYYAGPTGLPPHPAHGGAPTLCILEYP